MLLVELIVDAYTALIAFFVMESSSSFNVLLGRD